MRVVLLISDLHVGRKTKTFDYDVFRKRIETLTDNFIFFKKQINKAFALKSLDIVLLGDLLDGEEIYRGHGYEVEMSVDKAIDVVAKDILLMLNKILSRMRFDEVRIFGVVGNHGIANRSGSITANWERLLYRILKEQLDYTVEIGEEWYVRFDIGEKNAIAMHGDNVRMNGQIPFYGVNRSVLRWKAGVIDDFDYVFMGHFHTTASFSCNDVRVWMNGTMLDGDVYVERMGLKPDLSMWSIIFDEDGNEVMEVLIPVDRKIFKEK